MTSRAKHNYFALAALAAAVVFAIFKLAIPLVNGPALARLDNRTGLLAQHLAAGAADAPLLALQLFLGMNSVLFAVFIGCLFLRVCRPAQRSMARNEALIVAQLLIGLCCDSVLFNTLVAGQLAVLMPLRRGLACLAVQIVAGLAIDVYLIVTVLADRAASWGVLIDCILEYVVQAMGFGAAYLVGLERRSRLTIAASHAELLATQSMLGDMMRASERVRIARDLHDVIGHHLTALNLHLDLALRQTEGKAGQSLRTSRALADDLLESVRILVGSERQDQPVNLREALFTLCSGIPAPNIVLTFEDELEIDLPATAHALFCCVQEAITNAVRHAAADLLTIDIRRRGDQVVVAIADNGRGSHGSAEGNGLRGMRERLAQQGGGLRTANLPERGFGLDLWVAR